MAVKLLLFPNGYRTASDRLSAVRVYPERSPSFREVYVEVFEPGRCVYRGLIDLDAMEIGVDAQLYAVPEIAVPAISVPAVSGCPKRMKWRRRTCPT